MNNKKLTNVVALEMVLAMEEVKSNQELVEKLTKMIQILMNKKEMLIIHLI